MRYVLVPVPTEFVLDVMRWVLFRATEPEEEGELRDHSRIKNVLGDADDLTAGIVRMVATATIEDRPLRLSDAAEDLEEDADTVRACLRKLNGSALGGGRDLIAISTELGVGPLGKRGKVAYLTMRPDHARLVRSLT